MKNSGRDDHVEQRLPHCRLKDKLMTKSRLGRLAPHIQRHARLHFYQVLNNACRPQAPAPYSPGHVLARLLHAARNSSVHRRAGFLTMAKVKARMAGQKGIFLEGNALDAETAKTIPANMIGRALSL